MKPPVRQRDPMSSHQSNELARLKRPDEIDELFGRANPNPERIGCPPQHVLIALARRQRPIGDRAYDHLAECSPCYLEVRALKEAADLQHGRLLTWAAAAALLLAAGSVGWFVLNRGRWAIEPNATEIRTQLDLRPYALMRSEPLAELPPLPLLRGRVSLTLLLPTGSEPGPYEVQIRDSSATTKASASGNADLRSEVTTLNVTVDLGSLSRDRYHLAIRRSGEDWQMFPTQVQ